MRLGALCGYSASFFFSSSRKNVTSARRSHSGSEAVVFLPFMIVWLECSFHNHLPALLISPF